MAADPNRTILTGENPFIRLSATNGGTITTNASYWRIITCPAGPGHVLYLKSELTENRWLIYSDNRLHGQDPEFFNTGGVALPVNKQITLSLKLGL